MDPSEYECAICQNLLLDPVVGPCGHDYCQFCLKRWRISTSSRSTTVACPLCREPIPCELGVCVRLRETIQRFFPDEVKKRRIEAQDRKIVLDVESPRQQVGSELTSQRSAATAHASSMGGTSLASSTAQHHMRWASRQGTRMVSGLVATGSASVTPAAPILTPPVPSATTSGAIDTWVPPATLCFSLGWYDPAETRSRRSFGRRRRVMAA